MTLEAMFLSNAGFKETMLRNEFENMIERIRNVLDIEKSNPAADLTEHYEGACWILGVQLSNTMRLIGEVRTNNSAALLARAEATASVADEEG